MDDSFLINCAIVLARRFEDVAAERYITLDTELAVCARYGQWQFFYDRMKDFMQGKELPPVADIFAQWKKSPPQWSIIPADVTEQAEINMRRPSKPPRIEDLYQLLEGVPSELVLDIFYEPKPDVTTDVNLGDSSVYYHSLKKHMPDDTISTGCIHLNINPVRDLVGATMSGVHFQKEDGIFFKGANMRRAYLDKTIWDKDVSTEGMLLEGAYLGGAKGWTNERLARCYIDEHTTLPENVDREKIARLHTDIGMPAAPDFMPYEIPYALRMQEIGETVIPAP